MDTLFFAVTGVSVLLVLLMATVVVRLFLDDRRRSQARAAALVAMTDSDAVSSRASDLASPRAAEPVNTGVGERIHTRAADPVKPRAGQPASHRQAPVFRDRDELELRPAAAHAEDVTPMFAQPTRSSPWGARLAIVAPLAVIIIGAGIAFYPSPPDIAAPPPVTKPGSAPGDSVKPLELVSLKHSQENDRLTVTGLVQNPRASAPVSKVFATAFVFAADGTFLASARAPLDFTTVAPGDESPFVVTVPVKGQVARYRIGFRGEDGRVIAHVDRRGGGPIARVNEERP